MPWVVLSFVVALVLDSVSLGAALQPYNPPWTLLQYGGAILMVLAPILLYPFTKTVFLAVDLAVRKAS